jgi:hypothetical protein
MLCIDILENSYLRDNRLYIQAVFKTMGKTQFFEYYVVLRVTLVRQKMQNESECTFSSSFIAWRGEKIGTNVISFFVVAWRLIICLVNTFNVEQKTLKVTECQVEQLPWYRVRSRVQFTTHTYKTEISFFSSKQFLKKFWICHYYEDIHLSSKRF